MFYNVTCVRPPFPKCTAKSVTYGFAESDLGKYFLDKSKEHKVQCSTKEAIYNVIMGDFNSKSHLLSEMIRFYFKQIYFKRLIGTRLLNSLNHQNL